MDTTPCYTVFSDVDETLISCKSMFDFLSFYFAGRYGPAGARWAATVQEELSAQAARGIRREVASRSYYRAWAGETASDVAREAMRWHRERSVHSGFYVPETRAALSQHLANGAALALVSGAFPAVLRPIAQEVGAAQVMCTAPEEHGGVLTGEIVGVPLLGEGKREAVRNLLRNNPRVNAADCFAYGDHISDLPMLEEVGYPVVVGTSHELMVELPMARRLAVGTSRLRS